MVDDYVFARLTETETETGVPHDLIYTAADASFAGIDGQIGYQITPASRNTAFGESPRRLQRTGAHMAHARSGPGRPRSTTNSARSDTAPDGVSTWSMTLSLVLHWFGDTT